MLLRKAGTIVVKYDATIWGQFNKSLHVKELNYTYLGFAKSHCSFVLILLIQATPCMGWCMGGAWHDTWVVVEVVMMWWGWKKCTVKLPGLGALVAIRLEMVRRYFGKEQFRCLLRHEANLNSFFSKL